LGVYTALRRPKTHPNWWDASRPIRWCFGPRPENYLVFGPGPDSQSDMKSDIQKPRFMFLGLLSFIPSCRNTQVYVLRTFVVYSFGSARGRLETQNDRCSVKSLNPRQLNPTWQPPTSDRRFFSQTPVARADSRSGNGTSRNVNPKMKHTCCAKQWNAVPVRGFNIWMLLFTLRNMGVQT